MRQGLVSVLGDEDDLDVVGAAGSGREAIALAQRLRPDVVLLDLEMPDLDGVAAIPQLLAAQPELGVLVFTAYDTDERVLGAVRAGARGYLLKGASADEIARGIRAVHARRLVPRAARGQQADGRAELAAPRGDAAEPARARGPATGGRRPADQADRAHACRSPSARSSST